VLDTIMGVPAHALIVHVTVVLLPLAAICAIAIALVPPLRRRYGLLVGLLTLVAVGSVPVAKASGEHLYDRRSAQFGPGDVTEAGLMQRHADLAAGLLPRAVLLLAGVALVLAAPVLVRQRTREAALVGGAPRSAPAPSAPAPSAPAPSAPAPSAPAPSAAAVSAPAWTKVVAAVGAVVTLVGAVLTLVLVIRIGHAGAEAAWSRVDHPQGLVRIERSLGAPG
jgi:hypothetical protein